MRRLLPLLLLLYTARADAAGDPFLLGMSCAVGGTNASAFTRADSTAVYFPAAPVGTIIGGTCGTGGPTSTTEALRQFATPVAGTARNLVCWEGVAPGVGDTTTFTVRLNGASPANGLTCGITGTARFCVDGSHTITVALGDLLGILQEHATTPTASSAGGCYFQVDP